jgi:acetolactate decarboxylase
MINLKLAFYLLTILSLAACSRAQKGDALYQVSTINALLGGVYEGSESFADLKKHGDFGIGTFDELDGEMLALDGEFYRVRADGKLYKVNNDDSTPFASVVFFQSDNSFEINDDINYNGLITRLDESLPSENLFYAIKISGTFKKVKTRSVPKQNKPYKDLVEVVESQPTFEFENVEGTLVGFRCPPYSAGVNVPGYHFHFISKDKSGGGHVMDCKLDKVEVKVDYKNEFIMSLPDNKDFLELDLSKDKEAELDKVEKK